MGKNLVQKIIAEHLIEGVQKAGEEIKVKIDQVLTQDATGTMAWLQFEAIGVPRVKVETAVSYVDHNMLQVTFRNADDHRFLQTAANKYGAYFSRPGNGICHQVHLERFAKPGAMQLGTDSHTPTAGGMGAIAIGVGGLDAAVVLAGSPYEMRFPKVLGVMLSGDLDRPWVAAMDVILEMLRRRTVKGGTGFIVEYHGPGAKNLNVTERATITNMGAELGATTSLFPSDEITLDYLKAQSREDVWRDLQPDSDAEYDEIEEIDLDELEPLIAQPHQPDKVVKVKELAGLPVDQVCVGSCTNSSYQVMMSVASILKGRTIHPRLSMTVSPGSKQVYTMITESGAIKDMISAGARILESACGPCIGMGAAPGDEQVSVRSFNRNFFGRSGTKSAKVYLCNPFVATAMALKGEMFDPRGSDLTAELVDMPGSMLIDDNMLVPPADDPSKVEVVKGPNIQPVPVKEPMPDVIGGKIGLMTGDNISTDDIMPAGSEVLQYRSNIPAISEYVYSRFDEEFVGRVKGWGQHFAIIGAENYGQGSSREHAAIAPMYLGLRFVIVKSFARIHRQNLINWGVLPLRFEKADDYDKFKLGDEVEIRDLHKALEDGGNFRVTVRNLTNGEEAVAVESFSGKDVACLKYGGLLPYTKEMNK
ncbi:MAG TPA: aconitate hydratase [Acidobacteriota bacterium]|nr:aconitate hydratase [Acidobacteriota bacterium]